MSFRRSTSLRRRITLTGVSVVTVLVLAFNAFVYLSLRNRLYSELERVLDAREQLVRGLAEGADGAALRDQLDALGVRAVVRTPEGDELRSAGAPAFDALPANEAAREEELAARFVTLPGGGEVAVIASYAGITATLDRLLLLEVAGTVTVVLLAYVLLARTSARVLRPVRDVARTARRIADGELQQRLPEPVDGDELAEMVIAFNAMVAALGRSLERTKRSEELSRQFLADAAHQLRNPVAGVRASVATILRTDDPTEQDRLLDNVAAELARMSRLLSALLRVARLDSRERPNFERQQVEGVVVDAVEQQKLLAPHLDITVVSAGDSLAEVDGASLTEALQNLLDNSRRHAASRVTVAISSTEEELVICVRDDGPGVPDGARERVFERFVSMDGGEGSGLGLPIARGIARSHGGDLAYEEGAFILRMPLEQPSTTPT